MDCSLLVACSNSSRRGQGAPAAFAFPAEMLKLQHGSTC